MGAVWSVMALVGVFWFLQSDGSDPKVIRRVSKVFELDQTGWKLGHRGLFGACGFWHLALVSSGKQHMLAELEKMD